MPYPTIKMMEVGDDYRVYIEFSHTHKIMFGTVIGYEGNINDAGRPDDSIIFWGDDWDTYLEISNEGEYAEVNAQFYKGSTQFRIPKINWQNWTVFYENVVGGTPEITLPYMTEGEWVARFQEGVRPPPERPPGGEPPEGGRKRKTRMRKIKRRKTHRKGK